MLAYRNINSRCNGGRDFPDIGGVGSVRSRSCGGEEVRRGVGRFAGGGLRRGNLACQGFRTERTGVFDAGVFRSGHERNADSGPRDNGNPGNSERSSAGSGNDHCGTETRAQDDRSRRTCSGGVRCGLLPQFGRELCPPAEFEPGRRDRALQGRDVQLQPASLGHLLRPWRRSHLAVVDGGLFLSSNSLNRGILSGRSPSAASITNCRSLDLVSVQCRQLLDVH